MDKGFKDLTKSLNKKFKEIENYLQTLTCLYWRKNGPTNAKERGGLNIKNGFIDWRVQQWRTLLFGKSGITNQNFSLVILALVMLVLKYFQGVSFPPYPNIAMSSAESNLFSVIPYLCFWSTVRSSIREAISNSKKQTNCVFKITWKKNA